MGSRSIGDVLLRPSSLSRLSPSHPSFSVRRAPPSWSPYRTITNSSSPRSAQPQPREDHDAHNQAQPPNNRSANPSNRTSSQQVSETIDDIFAAMNTPTYRRTMPAATSSDELRAAQVRHTFGSNFSTPSGNLRRQPLDFNQMNMPSSLDGLSLSVQNTTPSGPPIPESERIYPRLNASYGRTVELAPEKGRDLVRGISMLGSLTARNKVRADFMKQRFHERPGLKRKRLKSERWRARFKAGFRDVTARVSELTSKGW